MQALGLPPPPPQMQRPPGGFAPVAAPVAPPNPFSSAPRAAVVPAVVNTVADMAMMLGEQQNQPVIVGLSGHIRNFWTIAENAKRTVEQEMFDALYARRGEYTAAKRAEIVAQNQPPIYMLVASAKMHQIEALLRDVLLGTGADKPWTMGPSPSPTLPPELVSSMVQGLATEIEMLIQSGIMPTQEQVRQRLRTMRDQLDAQQVEEAQIRAARMETKMEDQLLEGGILDALDEFIVDLATFKTAFVKGPVIRNKPKLDWGEGGVLVVDQQLSLEWERVDPFRMYPAPWAKNINESGVPLIERHTLTREGLNQLIGVEGYSEPAIRKVLDEYGRGGLHNWLSIDSQKAAAEGKDQVVASTNTGTIDAIQFWGSASGQMLVDWGLDPAQVPDLQKEYQIEAWLIGAYVIKAVLNSDPLARRPYYGFSFQRVPGSVWGNAPFDLMRDCQDMCNGAARSLAANLGIASGPQASIISDRIPNGEELTEMFPWKIWQFTSDPMGSTAAPIQFFQPQSNAAELMTVFERFSQLADEAVGVPRYMAGFQGDSGGAGRTASGMSMMIGNASKVIKQVLGGIDQHIISKLLDRLYYYNMRYGDDPDLKGDVLIVARGAMSLATKEAAQVRRNEFLQATANPFDMQILGMDGRAEVLRATAKTLDLNADKVVPPVAVLKERAALAAAQQQMQLSSQSPGGTPPNAETGGQQLGNGAPVTDQFEPAAAP